MEKLRVAIVDDEVDARIILRNFLTNFCPEVEVVGEAEGIVTGVRLLKESQPDVLLLDIQMDDGTGFELLDKITKPSFQVVFTTAFDQYALKAFRYSAIDYLLKPIDPDDLIRVIDRLNSQVREKITSEQISHLSDGFQHNKFDKIALPSSEGLVFLALEDIINLESDGNYTTFFVQSAEKVIISQNIKEFEQILPSHQFFRPHQSHIINLQFVKKFLREDGGYALLENGRKVPVSRRKKNDFLKVIGKQFSLFGKKN